MPLSPLGIFHTVLAMSALISVAMLLWQDKRINFERALAKFYLAATLLTAASALAIFRHGAPNAAHGLAVLTIVAIVVGILASKVSFLGGVQKYFVELCFSSTVLFHLLPTATEILTRFPLDAPLVDSLEAPLLLKTFATIVTVFLVMLGLQMNWLRNQQS